MKKLAIICSHPIQYYAPVFQLLANDGNLEIKVFYTGGKQLVNAYDKGFQKEITWDIPLLEGYNYQFLANTASKPGTHHFNGIVNPDGVQCIEAFHPDALLIYGWAYQSHLHILRYFKGRVPVGFRGDSTLLDRKNNIRDKLRSIFLKWVYRHIDYAFYTGSANKKYFKAAGLKDKQLVFAPHAIDNDRFGKAMPGEAIAIRNVLGLNPTDILVLFTGKFIPKKNPLLLLNAFTGLAQKDLHLLFVGNGELESLLKENSTHALAKNRIHFMDFKNQSQMPGIYQACDLFCLPSAGPGETWGLAVNEAMAAGKAVLVSDKAGCAEDLVKDEINGYIFRSGDPDDLGRKLHKLCEDKITLQTYGAASETLIKNFTFTMQEKNIMEKII